MTGGEPAARDRILERIRRHGPMPFAEFMDIALYDPAAGFFARGRGAGRGGDFLTSPEVGPLFGAVLARALDAWWEELGRPDPYVVVDAGAGTGTLAAAVLAAAPACGPALRYVLVERSEALRRRQAGLVALEPPGLVLGPGAPAAGEDGSQAPGRPAAGPLATSLPTMPAGPMSGVIVANELLDNLPFDLVERAGDAGEWHEVRVGESEGELQEVLVPAPGSLGAEAERYAPGAPAGARIPLARAARRWLAEAIGALDRGRIVVVDYADSTPSLALRPWTEWVRTYRDHRRGAHPFDAPGVQDITCEVAVDQLETVARPSIERSQAEFLEAYGIDALVEQARREWYGRAGVGDLAAVRARSRVVEGAALVDPSGLGSFRVIEWTKL